MLNPYPLYGGRAEQGFSRDLSADPDLPSLLEEREQLGTRMASDKKRLDEVDMVLQAALGDSASGQLLGWSIFWVWRLRRGYEVPGGRYRFL
jgi:hypothetical protein